MFPLKFFPKLMGKAIQTLKLGPQTTDTEKDNSQLQDSSKFFPFPPINKTLVVPVPVSFKETIEAEWMEPAKSRRTPKSISRLYGMPKASMMHGESTGSRPASHGLGLFSSHSGCRRRGT